MNFPYFKLAVWDSRQICFRDGKRAYPSETDARADAKQPGKYRVSEVNRDGRVDGVPFTIAGKPPAPARNVPFKHCRPTAASLAHGKRYGVPTRKQAF